METIKGKIEFLAIPAFNHEIYGRKCHRLELSTTESDDVTELRKNNEWFYLAESTEEQCQLFVDYAECIINGIRVFYNYVNKTTSLPTAKESLFSLLKANGCWTKEWYAEDYEHLPIIRESLCDKAPDDYLLIIKQ